MASSSSPVHPYRYLTLFLVLLIGVYALVFLTGDKQAKPKLGIDLQGGTRVTLTARTPDGSRPTREALLQAQEIITARVNGLGVSGSEVASSIAYVFQDAHLLPWRNVAANVALVASAHVAPPSVEIETPPAAAAHRSPR